MSVSAADVKKLRDRTNAPFGDCKAALTEANGDMDKAVEIMRKKNAAIKDKKGERETAEGRVAVWIDPAQKIGAIVDMRCESAPVAKTDIFVKLAENVARQVAVLNPPSVEALLAAAADSAKTVNDLITEAIGLIRENMKVARFTRLEGLLGSYVHHDGSVGVLLQVSGAQADTQLLRDVCMHITARNPLSARREDVPAEVIAKEKEIAKAQAASTGKPENILEKIAEGKLKTWFSENVLLEQPFVKDDSKTVGDLLKSAGLTFSRFVRYQVGQVG